MSWTRPTPTPPPPGPTNDVSHTDPTWLAWGNGLVDRAWQAYLWSSLGPPKDPYFRIKSTSLGRRIPFPIGGDDPGTWEADGGRWDGTLESDLGVFKVGTEVDYTRYRRTYPRVAFQDYQELIVHIEYGWGTCGAWHHFWWGTGDCLHASREVVFWYPVGQPREEVNLRAYRWVHTSTKKEGGVSIPAGGDVEVGASGSGSTFIPWDPGANPPKEPEVDDFHPDHGQRPGGQRNGPYTGYGPLSIAPRFTRSLETAVALAIAQHAEEAGISPTAFAKAFIAASTELRLLEAETSHEMG